MGGMRVKFNKQVTVDFLGNQEEHGSDKTFYHNQIVEVERMEETVRGFVDLIFENGDTAVGIDKQSVMIIGE